MNRRTVLLATSVAGLLAAGVGLYLAFFRAVTTIAPPPPPPVSKPRAKAPVPTVPFTDVTHQAGVRFVHANGANGHKLHDKLLPETMGGGVCVLDYNNDRKPDLLFVSGCPWPGAGTPAEKAAPCLALYRNTGDGTFADETQAAGLGVTLYGMGVCAGDVDNDGFTDVFVSGVGGHRLFRNVSRGTGRGFEDVTAKAGVLLGARWPGHETAEQFAAHADPIPFGSSATFFDYDRDGKLDLFVCHYVTWAPKIDLDIKSNLIGTGRTYQQPQQLEGSQCALLKGNGDGTFADVTKAAGVEVTRPDGTGPGARRRPVAKALAVAACDPDGDGWADVVVGNDTVQNFFFRNVEGGNGSRRFEEVSEQVNAAYADGRPRGAMGVDFAEYRPGEDGLVIANFANEPCTFLVTARRGPNLQFANKALGVGLEGQDSRVPLKFGAFFFDYDLDGRLDVLLANGHLEPDIAKIQAGQAYKQPARLFWNTGGDGWVQFEPVPAAGALGTPIVGRGSAYLDFDGDGDLDVVLVSNGGPALLLRNDGQTGNHHLRLTLVGDGKTANRSAIGAQVTVTAGGKTVRREVTGARGYLSQSEQVVTVGLGGALKADKVTVRWPAAGDRPPQEWADLAADRAYTLTQGDPAAK